MDAAHPSSCPRFLLNGCSVTFPSASPMNLLDFVRSQGLTGAKEGCAEGECGACAVAMVVEDGSGSAYRIVNSCLLPVRTVAGQEIYTVESLATDGRLADAQSAMASSGGSQCGYCTPGFVMSLFGEQYRRERDGPCEPLALSGNLCRCGAYRAIRDAARSLGPPPSGPLRDRLARPAPVLDRLEVDDFARPRTIAEALAVLAAHPQTTVIAGATDLGVESNLRGRRWSHLVSLEGIRELRQLSDTPDRVRIGAGVTLTDIGRQWTKAPAVIAEWLGLFASPLIRNRATLGGNLATASPIGDGAPLLAALDASVEIAGPSGRRSVPLATFFTGYRRTAMRAGEILTYVDIPKPLPSVIRFYKIAKRRFDDISTVAAAMAVDRDAAGHVIRARFAFGGVAATPVRILEAETAITGGPFNETAVERAQAALDRTLTPLSDHRGSKEFRLEVCKSLVARFWTEARS
jgi:xanthine dehydrogenase small subunit